MADYTIDKFTYGNDTYHLDDEKLSVNVASADTTYYPVLSTNSSTASTKFVDAALSYNRTAADGVAHLTLGNSNATPPDVGILKFIAYNGYDVVVYPASMSANRDIHLPDKSGTFALTSDITTATLSATDDGAGNVTLSVSGTTMANGVSF